MDEKNNPEEQVNRRAVLKSGVGAGLGAAGLSQSAIAIREPTSDELEWVRSHPRVQSILNELGHSGLPQGVTAETKEVDTTEFDMKAVSLDFGYGTLQVGRVGDEVSAMFLFEDDGNARRITLPVVGIGRPRPPKEYQNIPEGADAWLLGAEDDAVFLRTATPAERRSILDALPGQDIGDTQMYTRSDLNGFQVDEFNDGNDDVVARYRVTPVTGTMTGVEPASTEYDLSAVEVEQLATPEFISRWGKAAAEELAKDLGFSSLQAVTDSCGPEIAECVVTIVGKITGCFRCGPPCAGSPSGVGAVVCFLCVFGFCSQLLSAVPCAAAAECVGD